jgi:hypothetical protein
MAVTSKLKTPYLDKFRAINGGSYSRDDSISTYARRDKLVQRYAWAVPNKKAIETIVDHSPIIEIAAGSGYWASLAEQLGADVDAYDKEPWEDTWTDVLEGTDAVVDAYPERSLFLCWPPYGAPVADDALQNYDGMTVIYVGEGKGGCTGDKDFHKRLEQNWRLEEQVSIPQWWGIHDTLRVYKRM